MGEEDKQLGKRENSLEKMELKNLGWSSTKTQKKVKIPYWESKLQKAGKENKTNANPHKKERKNGGKRKTNLRSQVYEKGGERAYSKERNAGNIRKRKKKQHRRGEKIEFFGKESRIRGE